MRCPEHSDLGCVDAARRYIHRGARGSRRIGAGCTRHVRTDNHPALGIAGAAYACAAAVDAAAESGPCATGDATETNPATGADVAATRTAATSAPRAAAPAATGTATPAATAFTAADAA